MKEKQSIKGVLENSGWPIKVAVTEAWINKFLAHQQVVIPVNDQYTLCNLQISMNEGKISLQADIKEKVGTAIRIVCLPTWEVNLQLIQFEELEIKTLTKNLLIKSAGWFAKTFMGAKMDKRIEIAANQLYQTHLSSLLNDGLKLPIPEGGRAVVGIDSVFITAMSFLDGRVNVKARVNGHCRLTLSKMGEETPL